MIKDSIQKQIFEAMKTKDEIRVSTLKLLSAALINAEIAKRPDKLTTDDELVVIQKEAKKRRDAIEAYQQAQGKLTRTDLGERIKREEKELEILQEFLPTELADEEIAGIIAEAVSQIGAFSVNDFGKVMGMVMAKTKGRVDGKKVAELVKKKLSSL